MTSRKTRMLGAMLAYFGGFKGGPRVREVSKAKIDGMVCEIKTETSDEVKITKLASTTDLVDAIAKHRAEWFRQAPLSKTSAELAEVVCDLAVNSSFFNVHGWTVN